MDLLFCRGPMTSGKLCRRGEQCSNSNYQVASICIWGADSSSSNDNCSPHPLKLLDTILTGHRANIFSAKYLPNTSTPTIVSCAGDSLIKIFEVERLGRAELGRGNELWGESGTGYVARFDSVEIPLEADAP